MKTISAQYGDNVIVELSGDGLAALVESKEEQAFVYDIIRQNFLIGNSGSMSEEERQANISLGMKKAEYAAENFISEDNKSAFLDAMESITKLAAAGSSDASGNMDQVGTFRKTLVAGRIMLC